MWFPLRFCSWFPLRFLFMFFYGFHRWIFGGFCRRRRIQTFRTSRAIPFFCVFRTGFRRWLFYGFRRGRKTFLFMVSVVGFFVVSSVARNFCMASVVVCLMVSGCYRTAAFSPMETVKQKTSGRFRDELSICTYYSYYYYCYYYYYYYYYY